jgi:plasmid stabilization system protein ParE
MARKRKVIWTETAKDEFKQTCIYWNKRNGSFAYANRLRKLLKSTLEKIALFPKSGVPSNFEAVRFVVIRDYLLFYHEANDNIIVLSFWDGRQDPQKLGSRLT